MQAYRTEGNYRSAARLSAAELRAAMASHEILQATALAFDTQRQLRFDLGGVRAVMPFVQCADGFEIYNNNDRIAFLTFEDTHVLLMLGTQFFCSIVYSLCVKYSIEKI